MNIVSSKGTIEKVKRNGRKAVAQSNGNALQQKLDKGNQLLSKVMNPEVLR